MWIFKVLVAFVVASLSVALVVIIVGSAAYGGYQLAGALSLSSDWAIGAAMLSGFCASGGVGAALGKIVFG